MRIRVLILASLLVAPLARGARAADSAAPAPNPTPVAQPAAAPSPAPVASPAPALVPQVVATPQPTPVPESRMEPKPHNFGSVRFALNYFNFNYAENVPAPKKSTETGNLLGVSLGYDVDVPGGPWFLGVALDFTPGSTNFDGTDQVGNPILNKTSTYFYRFEVLGGLTVLHFGSTLPTEARLYAGLESRHWARGTESNPTNGAYREDYAWADAPLGARIELRPSDRLAITLDGAMTVMLFGTVDAKLSQVDASLSDTTSTLSSKLGVHVTLPVSYALSRKLSLLVTPWYEGYMFGKGSWSPLISNGQQVTDSNGNAIGVYEPESRTHQFGSMLGVAMRL